MAKEVLSLLVDNGAHISESVVDSWLVPALNVYSQHTGGFSDFVHAIPNPFIILDGQVLDDVIESVSKRMLLDTAHDPSIPAATEVRKASALKALAHARSLKPVVLNPEGRHVTIRFNKPASRVFVTGAFDSWKQSIEMSRADDGSFYKEFVLDNGQTYQFKFVVDGNWMATEDYPKSDDGQGNINNVI